MKDTHNTIFDMTLTAMRTFAKWYFSGVALRHAQGEDRIYSHAEPVEASLYKYFAKVLTIRLTIKLTTPFATTLLRRVSFSLLVLAMLVCSACRSLDTTLSIPTREVPTSFVQPGAFSTSTTASIATLKWREYFKDSLLVRLIDTALMHNFDLRIALQRVELAQANTTFTKGELLPRVYGNIGAGVRKYGLYTMDGAGNISTEILPGKIVPINLPDMALSVQTSWEADIWGKLRSRDAAATAQYMASIEASRFVVTSLIAELAKAYYELIALDQERDIVRQTLQKHQEALSAIQFQKEAGRANELAVQQFEAQVLHLQALEQQTLHNIALQEHAINLLLGRFPQPIQRSKETLSAPMPEQVASGVPSQLLTHRPDIREAELQVKAAQCDLEAARAAFFPTLTLSAALGFQAYDPQFLFLAPASLAYSLLGGLVAPLLNQQHLEAQFAGAKANQLQAMYHYQRTIVSGVTEVMGELITLQRLQEVSALKKQQRSVLQESVEIAGELYKSAKATYIEFLLAQENSLQAQLELVAIQKRQRIALVHLYKALGGGWR
jgi:NodT family efflux transporter outer membrane factor (OMF) lipoprotein